MSEDTTEVEVQETETEAVENPNATLEALSKEDLVKETLKLRREAAKKRTQNAALDAELAEFKAWKESQLTELEKAQAKAAALEEELNQTKTEKAQRDAAKKAGLDPDLSDRVRGDTPDEMLEDAKRLAEKFKHQRVDSTDLFGGAEGKKPVGSKTADSAGWFKDLLQGK